MFLTRIVHVELAFFTSASTCAWNLYRQQEFWCNEVALECDYSISANDGLYLVGYGNDLTFGWVKFHEPSALLFLKLVQVSLSLVTMARCDLLVLNAMINRGMKN